MLEVPTGPFIDEQKLEKIETVAAFHFNNIPHFKNPPDSGTTMTKETFKQFFPDKKLSHEEAYDQNDHLKIVEWLVTTREVIERAIKQNTSKSFDHKS